MNKPQKDRLRAVSLFPWSVEQTMRDTQMTTRVTKDTRLERPAALVSRLSRLCHSTLALAFTCTPRTKSEEKERLLAVYKKKMINSFFFKYNLRMIQTYFQPIKSAEKEKIFSLGRKNHILVKKSGANCNDLQQGIFVTSCILSPGLMKTVLRPNLQGYWKPKLVNFPWRRWYKKQHLLIDTALVLVYI